MSSNRNELIPVSLKLSVTSLNQLSRFIGKENCSV